MTTSYQLSNEDGTIDRFVIVTAIKDKLVRVAQFIAEGPMWLMTKRVSTSTIAHKRKPEDTEMLFHSKTRRELRKKYRHRLEFNNNLSTIL